MTNLANTPLEWVPLGGLGEFGLNMMALRLGGDVLLIDCGLMFPGDDAPGVQLMMPDTSFLREEQPNIVGLVLTHGHEDHLGALPYLLAQEGLPSLDVFATPLTIAMCRSRVAEHGVDQQVRLHEVTPGEKFSVGPFGIELIRVAHSLADAVAVAIDTPWGRLLHTGDFKIDGTPVVGSGTDVKRLAQLGSEGVLCLLSDSTNSDVSGHTPSESDVRAGLSTIVANAPKRVLLSCFSSSTHRVQLALDLAKEHGRKVALVGRSMTENFSLATDYGFLRYAGSLVVSPQELDELPRNQQLVVCAGSQGETASALSQIALDSHRYVSLAPGDEVILSARVIPGNESNVSKVINLLYRLGAKVHYKSTGDDGPIHVSGHGSAEDLNTMLELTKPKHFIPIHGEWRMLYHHAEIAREWGLDDDRVHLCEDGEMLRFDRDGASRIGDVQVGRQYLDASGLGIIDECALRDRRRLGVVGLVVPMVSLGTNNEPEVSDILSHGFVENETSDALLNEAHDAMLSAVESLGQDQRENVPAIEDTLHATLNRFFRKRTSRRPVIVPVVVGPERS